MLVTVGRHAYPNVVDLDRTAALAENDGVKTLGCVPFSGKPRQVSMIFAKVFQRTLLAEISHFSFSFL
jgi:hypothetical protein